MHDKVNARVVTEDDNHVFYTSDENPDNDCPDEVVDVVVVVQMFNEGKDLGEIDEYLLDAECTQDAREIMVESLYLLFNPKNQ